MGKRSSSTNEQTREEKTEAVTELDYMLDVLSAAKSMNANGDNSDGIEGIMKVPRKEWNKGNNAIHVCAFCPMCSSIHHYHHQAGFRIVNGRLQIIQRMDYGLF